MRFKQQGYYKPKNLPTCLCVWFVYLYVVLAVYVKSARKIWGTTLLHCKYLPCSYSKPSGQESLFIYGAVTGLCFSCGLKVELWKSQVRPRWCRSCFHDSGNHSVVNPQTFFICFVTLEGNCFLTTYIYIWQTLLSTILSSLILPHVRRNLYRTHSSAEHKRSTRKSLWADKMC